MLTFTEVQAAHSVQNVVIERPDPEERLWVVLTNEPPYLAGFDTPKYSHEAGDLV